MLKVLCLIVIIAVYIEFSSVDGKIDAIASEIN